MKRFIFFLFTLLSAWAAYSQSGSLSQSVYRSRVNDSTTVVGSTASGYGFLYWNNDPSSGLTTDNKWKFWDGTSEVSIVEMIEALSTGSGGSGGVNSFNPNIQTGSYSAIIGDTIRVTLMRSASAQNYTVPANTFPIGAFLNVVQDSTGTTTIVAGGATVFENPSGTLTLTEDEPVVLYQYASNRWFVWKGGSATGDIIGPVSSTDNAIPKWVGTAGDELEDTGVLIDGSQNVTPATNDVGGLGTTSLKWADLFLADGAVINFNSGDVTLTHSSNAVTVSGGDWFVPAEAYGAGWNGDDSAPTKNDVYDKIESLSSARSWTVAASDEVSVIASGTAKVTFRMPYAITLSEVRASLNVAQTGNGAGGIFTINIKENGTTILSTKITIDNGETTSVTAATPPVISDSSIADDSIITIDVDQIGDGTAIGLKVTLKGS